jgi:steroid delta-isomerase-like uncharacterized protein
VVGNGKIDVLDDIAADDVVDHTAKQFGWRSGRDGWIDHVDHFRAALPDVAITVRRIVADEDNVVGCWRGSGTHSNELFGAPATGRTLTGEAVSLFEVRNGRVVDDQVVVDLYPLMRQMGVIAG